MTFTRRQALGLSAGAAALSLAGAWARPVFAAADDAGKMILEFTGGAEPGSGRITLIAPEIAENGNSVPVSFTVDSPMSADDHVASVMIVADGNPNPKVATFHFTELSGEATATTRMRLAKTQTVIAIARMSDGSVFADRKEVKVTIGGCGG